MVLHRKEPRRFELVSASHSQVALIGFFEFRDQRQNLKRPVGKTDLLRNMKATALRGYCVSLEFLKPTSCLRHCFDGLSIDSVYRYPYGQFSTVAHDLTPGDRF